jgi:hypothetical protein
VAHYGQDVSAGQFGGGKSGGGQLGGGKLSGQSVIGELLRNMELGRFELAYSVLLPCVFNVYLHPEDHAHLAGVFPLIAEDARKALRNRVSQLNARPKMIGLKVGKAPKEFKIACREWVIDFLANAEVPPGDVEIHSELNETVEPGFRGTKTTLMDREPSVTSERVAQASGLGNRTRKSSDRVFAEIQYVDDSGPQTYLIAQNDVSIGRGGDGQFMDLALYASDDVSREHMRLRRDPATGVFLITDKSTNGTWLNGKRLKRGVEEALPEVSDIGIAEVLTLAFRARR